MIAIFAVSIFYIFSNKNNNEENINDNKLDTQLPKKVEIFKLTNNANDISSIKVAGVVKASTQIDIVSLAQGTLKSINFKVGDNVQVNQALARLYNSSTLVNLSNARVNYNNVQNNLNATKKINEENIKQSEINVKQAQESIKSAKIGLKTAQDNLENAKIIQIKNNQDIEQNAIISFEEYINDIDNALIQINYIIHADTNQPQLSGIDDVLGVKNTQNLANAKVIYNQNVVFFSKLKGIAPNPSTITNNFKSAIDVLTQSKKAVDATIEVLNNTITSIDFSDASLNTQKTTFNTLASSLISSISEAKSTLQSLENITLTNKQELDALENAINVGENQLSIANIAYATAVSALENSKQYKEQNIVSAQTSLDGSLGQLNLARVQTGDLRVKAPISGQITKKYVELGAEINPGTKIAEISQTNELKIEVNLSSQDIYRIKAGEQNILINDTYSAKISHIDPSADMITKKVKVEILFDNVDNILIPGTFVKVKITPKNILSQKEFDNNVQVFLVPLRAVIIDQNESYVFVHKQGIASKINVTTGDIKGDSIVITGVKIGDEVVVKGNRGLKHEDKITI